jgi:hypothetical protein
MTFTYSDDLYSDLHKDARGVRPGNAGAVYWDTLSPAEKQIQWDALVREMDERYIQEAAMEDIAILEFEAAVDAIIENGAAGRETAIRWMIEAEDDNQCRLDSDYFCYIHGLPYGYVNA